MAYFVVSSYHGPAWVSGRPMREQPGWPAHREFMNALPDGFVILGGPVDGHRHRAMLVVKADDLDTVHRILDPDPWVATGVLVELIEPWEILVGQPP
ncbi:MAG TPA: YciI family protein [Thermoplasmata archaeon]|nr:YciI family protein [Thermoplasmata archaeon]